MFRLVFSLLIFIGAFNLEARELHSLTKKWPEIDFGDPSPPDFSDPKAVRVYTTGGEVLTWRRLTDFLEGGPVRHERLRIYHSDGVTLLDAEVAGEDAWDPTVQHLNGQHVMFAGVMRPTDDRRTAMWPDDHWNRRTHAFLKREGRWVMAPESIFGKVPEMPTWVNHNYGHGLLQTERGPNFMFYERVTEERNGLPWTTELFARKLGTDLRLRGEEISILKIPRKVWPSARREFGGALLEGPRPFQVGRFFLIAFSAGDYMSDRYGIHLAWAEKPEGPYRPYMSGHDLKDFGEEIERELPLTWGAARPAFFEARGEWWVLFHGIRKSHAPIADGKREVFLAPVQIEVPKNAPPRIRIVPRDS